MIHLYSEFKVHHRVAIERVAFGEKKKLMSDCKERGFCLSWNRVKNVLLLFLDVALYSGNVNVLN